MRSEYIKLIQLSNNMWKLTIKCFPENQFEATAPTKTEVIKLGLDMVADRMNILGQVIDDLKRNL